MTCSGHSSWPNLPDYYPQNGLVRYDTWEIKIWRQTFNLLGWRIDNDQLGGREIECRLFQEPNRSTTTRTCGVQSTAPSLTTDFYNRRAHSSTAGQTPHGLLLISRPGGEARFWPCHVGFCTSPATEQQQTCPGQQFLSWMESEPKLFILEDDRQ